MFSFLVVLACFYLKFVCSFFCFSCFLSFIQYSLFLVFSLFFFILSFIYCFPYSWTFFLCLSLSCSLCIIFLSFMFIHYLFSLVSLFLVLFFCFFDFGHSFIIVQFSFYSNQWTCMVDTRHKQTFKMCVVINTVMVSRRNALNIIKKITSRILHFCRINFITGSHFFLHLL